jgi:hypothetical protein
MSASALPTVALSAVGRKQIEQIVEGLIALLDAVDGDPDLEPSICGGINPDLSHVDDDREGGDVLDEGEPNDWDNEDLPYAVGDLVYFWTGRGSHGLGMVRGFQEGRVLVEPEPEAVRGSDARRLATGREYWSPRDRGIPLAQINSVPRFWYRNF